METIFIFGAAALIAYHVISVARRQSRLVDLMEEHISLARVKFPDELALKRCIEHLERSLVGGSVTYKGPSDPNGDLKTTTTTGYLERIRDTMAKRCEELARHIERGGNSIQHSIGHLEHQLTGGVISRKDPNDPTGEQRIYTSFKGEFERSRDHLERLIESLEREPVGGLVGPGTSGPDGEPSYARTIRAIESLQRVLDEIERQVRR